MWYSVLCNNLSCRVEKEDEIGSLIKGCNFLLRNIPDEQFSYDRHGDPEYRFINTEPGIFPYLLVNIGSGVSIMKVSAKYILYGALSCMMVKLCPVLPPVSLRPTIFGHFHTQYSYHSWKFGVESIHNSTGRWYIPPLPRSPRQVEADDKYERIGGTSMGGGTFWGLGSLLTKAKGFDELLQLASEGDHRNVDLLVKDIYGKVHWRLIAFPAGCFVSASFHNTLFLNRHCSKVYTKHYLKSYTG